MIETFRPDMPVLMFLRVLFTAILSSACLILASAKPAISQSEQSIVALVNDEPITNFDVRQRMRLLTVTTRKQPSDAMRKKVIENLISERIQIQEANKSSVVITDDQVNEVFGRVAKSNNMTSDQLTTSFGQMGVNVKTMKEQIRARLAWRQVVQRKFRNQVSVNASQVDKAISVDTPSDDKQRATEFQLQRIRLELPDTPDQRTIASRLVEAGRLRGRINSCSSIAKVIKPLRKASSKEVGRKRAEQLAQPTRAILMATKEGQMTPPTITSSGIELYVVCARRSVNRDDKQRQQVRSKLLSQEYDILARRHLRDLRQDAFVEHR
jgi:peptidyl-prolyl cis-trans isomerase SurA